MIREFWLYDNGEEPFLAYYGLEDLKEDTSGRADRTTHVIDASGMPTKEEIRLAIEEFKALIKGRNAKFFIETKVPEVFEVIKWLEKLAAE